MKNTNKLLLILTALGTLLWVLVLVYSLAEGAADPTPTPPLPPDPTVVPTPYPEPTAVGYPGHGTTAVTVSQIGYSCARPDTLLLVAFGLGSLLTAILTGVLVALSRR